MLFRSNPNEISTNIACTKLKEELTKIEATVHELEMNVDCSKSDPTVHNGDSHVMNLTTKFQLDRTTNAR